jgi:Ankyrin repeats (3 copies)
MSTNFNCCHSVSRYVPNTGAEDIIEQITYWTTPEEFEQIRKPFPQFQLWHPTPSTRSTVLHKAAEKGNVQLIEYLVKQAPELLERGEYPHMTTPLWCAVEGRWLAATQTLLELGANPNIRMDDNGSLLHITAACILKSNEGESSQLKMDLTANLTLIMALLLMHGAECHSDDNCESLTFAYSSITLSSIKSFIQSVSLELAAEREEEQREVREILYNSKILPPSDLCRLVSEYT